jgi:WD40 repeat protein
MLKRCGFLLGLLLVACAPAANPGVNNDSAAATQPPPPYTEPVQALTLENIAGASLLGRLDQPGAPTTIFTYYFSPDSTRLAGLSNDLLIVWDLLTGEIVATTSRGGANEVFFSPDKTELYTLNVSGSVNAYDAETARSQNRFDAHSAYNNTKAYYPLDGWLALGGLNGEVKVWDLLERRSLVTIEAHELQISTLDFSPDGSLLATGGDEGSVRVWDWRERESLLEFSIEPDGLKPVRVAFSPSGDQIAVGTQTDVQLVTFPGGEIQHTLDIIDGGVSALMVYSPDGRYIVTGTQNREMTIWNAQTGELIAQLPGTTGSRVAAAFSPDSTMLLTAALDGAVNLWDLTRIADASTSRADLNIGSDQILIADWSDDSRIMAFFDASGAIYIWGAGEQVSQTAASS